MTLLRVILLLTCVNYIHCQYYDIFQSFQTFVQPQPSQPLNFYNDFTTRRPRPKQRVVSNGRQEENTRKQDKTITDVLHESSIRKTALVQQMDRQSSRRKVTIAPVNFFSTTPRAIRKTTKSPHLSDFNQHKSHNQQDSERNNQHKNENRQESQNKETAALVFYDSSKNSKPNSRESSGNRDRIRPNNKKTHNQPLISTNYESNNLAFVVGQNSVNDHTTRPSYYETTKTYLPNNNKIKNSNYYTTHNPLLNRPGVKPAVVHGPPITNRPITQRPEVKPQIHFDDDLSVTPEVISGPDEDYMSAADKKRYIDIAEKMCDKYKSLNVKQVEAIPLVPSPHPVRVNVSSCAPTTVPLVVGGKVVSVKEFPHMALLGWRRTKNRGYSWKCGGSLLSDQFILTAAHCAYQDRDDNVISGPPRIVQLGSSYLSDPKAVYIKVASVTRHPKYKLPKAYFDLALVKMAQTVTFSEMIKPACLGTPPPARHPIIATGWGKTEFGGFQSQELRSVSIPVWDISECHKALGISIKIPYGPSSDSQICAGERSGGKDTCQGDSGGPVQVQDGCTWRVVAVTSVGRFCGAADTPAIYATVQHPFISAVVFGNIQNDRNSNDRDNSHSTNNNQGNNNKENNIQSSNTNQQNNNFNPQTNGMTDGNRKQSKTGTSDNHGSNHGDSYNWNSNLNNGDYNQNNQRVMPSHNYNNQNNQNRNDNSNNFNNYNSQTTVTYNGDYNRNNQRVILNNNNQNSQNRNDNSNNNYNSQATESYSNTNLKRQDNYNPINREMVNIDGQYIHNTGSNNRDRYKQEDFVSNDRSDMSYNDGIWWT